MSSKRAKNTKNWAAIRRQSRRAEAMQQPNSGRSNGQSTGGVRNNTITIGKIVDCEVGVHIRGEGCTDNSISVDQMDNVSRPVEITDGAADNTVNAKRINHRPA